MKTTNCIVCSKEFDIDEMESVASLKINTTQFKICQECIDLCDPEDDYKEALSVIQSYLQLKEIKSCFAEVQDILNDIKVFL